MDPNQMAMYAAMQPQQQGPTFGQSMVTLGQMNAAQQGVNINQVMGSTFDPYMATYTFPPEKTGLVATLFPSDSTWHPLCNNDKLEIANHMFSIEGSNMDQASKNVAYAKVKDIVERAPEVKAMGVTYVLLIVCTILLLIAKLADSTLFMWVGFIAGGIALINYVYARFWARGAGVNQWTNFVSDFTSDRQSGMNKLGILKKYADEVRADKDRAASIEMRHSGYGGSSGTNAFAGAAIGSLVSRLF